MRKCICLICPKCGAHELQQCENPPENVHDWRFNISGYVVDRTSHCLVCDHWFDDREEKATVKLQWKK